MAKIPQTGFVKKLDANETRVGNVLPQTCPGASGQMDAKVLLHTTVRQYSKLPVPVLERFLQQSR